MLTQGLQLYTAYGNKKPKTVTDFELVIWKAVFNVYLGAHAEKEIHEIYKVWRSEFHERVQEEGTAISQWFTKGA